MTRRGRQHDCHRDVPDPQNLNTSVTHATLKGGLRVQIGGPSWLVIVLDGEMGPVWSWVPQGTEESM